MTASYYFWKWADNDLPGRPHEVQAALLRGELHPALQTFDACPLVGALQAAAFAGRANAEEWHWEVTPAATPPCAHFVFVTCPRINDSEGVLERFMERFRSLGLSGCDEAAGHVIPGFAPKRNVLVLAHRPRERHYDITAADLPALLREARDGAPDACCWLEDGHNRFVQARAQGRRWSVEWHECYDPSHQRHWGAQDRKRLAVLPGPYSPEGWPARLDPDLLTATQTVEIFRAFLQGDHRPATFCWRNLDEK